MALTSPGVEVVITDQSQYLPAPSGSLPLVVIATAQNKADGSGTAVAAATTAANAGKLYQVTSQRDLVNLYGSPFFYNTTNGTPIQGYELNEYGLLAAYSALGITNRVYVLRADIDLSSLVGKTGRPTGAPANGTAWLDTTTSTWGIYEFNATTGTFANQLPIVITDSTNLTAGVPNASIGNIGDYAVNAIQLTGTPVSSPEYFYKNTDNAWVEVGDVAWRASHPTVQGTSNPVTTTGSFTITLGAYNVVPVDPQALITVSGDIASIAVTINGLLWTDLTADVVDSKLCIYSSRAAITITAGSGTVLADIGITAGVFQRPEMFYGTSAQMPLWQTGQTTPRPTGSVWLKVGAAGIGLNPAVSAYSSTTSTWANKNTALAKTDWAVSNSMDSTGGKAIPAGSIYGQYEYNGQTNKTPVYLWERFATGPTVITGDTIPAFASAGYMVVKVSTPSGATLSGPYNVTVGISTAPTAATNFVTAWQAANIPYTAVSVTTDGKLQITHTAGGVIEMNDTVTSGYVNTGTSNGFIAAAGFVAGTTPGCKYGSMSTVVVADAATTTVSGIGTGVTATVTYTPAGIVSVSVGAGVATGYVVGDRVKVLGTALGGASTANDLLLQVTSVATGAPTVFAVISGVTPDIYSVQLSNWREFTYTANEGQIVAAPANNSNWFYSVTDEVDIMVQKGGVWVGYGTTNYSSSGFPMSGANATDPAGPIIAASAPTLQSDGTALVYGDLWIDTSNLEVYPVISRWELVDGVAQWVLLNNTDQVSSTGVLFADARWATSGSISPSDDPMVSIATLLDSNYTDLDAPVATLYPTGMLLWNTRRSGYNVKQFRTNYFSNANFPGESLPVQKDAWVSVSGNQSNGSPYMGRKAQRAMVVQALNAVVATNTDIRDEDNAFNLIAAPNYPELQPTMVALNADRGETAFIVGDTPMRLADDATAIQAWATNAAGATSTGEDGCVTRNTFLGLFYPSGITNDLSGNLVAVPSSHMMLRTLLRNDNIAYPWLAPAGTRRGNIENATNIGYLNGQTGEFQTIKTRVGIRDVLYTNFINPMVFFTGVGLLNYGNKSSFNSSSALDRVNVARLVAYIRRQLTLAARPFVFEPNDALTRQQIAGVVQTLMVDLVAKRGLYDYLVVCDDSNNTPARIDRNELWIDVAVEPVKAAEFIYIPVRILNTGELKA
jgi:hypothetical protein